jgi:DNA invertase Pin-like site-specific DNA recombinase
VIAFLYARVSTQDRGQDKPQRPELQVREMLELADRRKWAAEIFADAGYSGSKRDRPELDRMMALCRKRKCDVVVVYRFDRFARSTKHLVDALDEFNDLGIQFVSLHENVDTTTAQGKLLFHIFAAIAEFERELIRERVRSGLAFARSKGTKLGRPRSDARILANVEKIKALRASGETWEATARMVGVSIASARRAFIEAENCQKPLSRAIQ